MTHVPCTVSLQLYYHLDPEYFSTQHDVIWCNQKYPISNTHPMQLNDGGNKQYIMYVLLSMWSLINAGIEIKTMLVKWAPSSGLWYHDGMDNTKPNDLTLDDVLSKVKWRTFSYWQCVLCGYSKSVIHTFLILLGQFFYWCPDILGC